MTRYKITAQEQQSVIDALPDEKEHAYAVLICSVEAILWGMDITPDEFVEGVKIARVARNQGKPAYDN